MILATELFGGPQTVERIYCCASHGEVHDTDEWRFMEEQRYGDRCQARERRGYKKRVAWADDADDSLGTVRVFDSESAPVEIRDFTEKALEEWYELKTRLQNRRQRRQIRDRRRARTKTVRLLGEDAAWGINAKSRKPRGLNRQERRIVETIGGAIERGLPVHSTVAAVSARRHEQRTTARLAKRRSARSVASKRKGHRRMTKGRAPAPGQPNSFALSLRVTKACWKSAEEAGKRAREKRIRGRVQERLSELEAVARQDEVEVAVQAARVERAKKEMAEFKRKMSPEEREEWRRHKGVRRALRYDTMARSAILGTAVTMRGLGEEMRALADDLIEAAAELKGSKYHGIAMNSKKGKGLQLLASELSFTARQFDQLDANRSGGGKRGHGRRGQRSRRHGGGLSSFRQETDGEPGGLQICGQGTREPHCSSGPPREATSVPRSDGEPEAYVTAASMNVESERLTAEEGVKWPTEPDKDCSVHIASMSFSRAEVEAYVNYLRSDGTTSAIESEFEYFGITDDVVRPAGAELSSDLKNMVLDKELNERLNAIVDSYAVTDVTEVDKELDTRMKDIVSKYWKFREDTEELGRVDKPEFTQHAMNLKAAGALWAHRQRRIRGLEAEWLDKVIDEYLKMGVLRLSNSPINNRLVIAIKRDAGGKPKGLRLCVDMRDVNKRTVLMAHTLPNLDEFFEVMATGPGGKKNTLFWTVDAADGFFNIVAPPDSTWQTAFTQFTDKHHRKLEFTRLTMGHVNSVPVYQLISQEIYKELIGTRRARLMLDDLMGGCSSVEELEEVAHAIGRACKKHGIRLRKGKSFFGAKRIEVLGHVIDADGVHCNPGKVAELLDAPEPKGPKALASFLGLADFYRSHIPGYSTIAWPLTRLKRKGVDWTWGPEQRLAFATIKAALGSDPVLRPFNEQHRTICFSDASPYGLGGVLGQYDPLDGKIYLVKTWSRRLTDTEQKQAMPLLEVIAFKETLERWEPYLTAHREGTYDAATDARNLRWVWERRGTSSVSPKIDRLILGVQHHFSRMRLMHIKGESNPADWPSRRYMEEEIKKVTAALERGDPPASGAKLPKIIDGTGLLVYRPRAHADFAANLQKLAEGKPATVAACCLAAEKPLMTVVPPEQPTTAEVRCETAYPFWECPGHLGSQEVEVADDEVRVLPAKVSADSDSEPRRRDLIGARIAAKFEVEHPKTGKKLPAEWFSGEVLSRADAKRTLYGEYLVKWDGEDEPSAYKFDQLQRGVNWRIQDNQDVDEPKLVERATDPDDPKVESAPAPSKGAAEQTTGSKARVRAKRSSAEAQHGPREPRSVPLPTWEQIRRAQKGTGVWKSLSGGGATTYPGVSEMEMGWIGTGHQKYIGVRRRDTADPWVVWAPPDLLRYYIAAAHDIPSSGHQGVERTLAKVREMAWHPELRSHVREWVTRCGQCQRDRVGGLGKRREFRRRFAREPFQIVHSDLYTILKPTSDGFRHILVIVDAFTGLSRFIPLRDKEAGTVARAFVDEWITLFGAPVALFTDRGGEYQNTVMDTVADMLWIDRLSTAAYSSHANGVAERKNRDLKHLLHTLCREETEWASLLGQLAFALNTSRNARTGYSPYELAMGRRPRIVFDAVIAAEETLHADAARKDPKKYARDLVARQAAAWRVVARAQMTGAREETGAGPTQNLARFAAGDLVWRVNPEKSSPERNIGPFRVIEDVSDGGARERWRIRNMKTGFYSTVDDRALRPYLRRIKLMHGEVPDQNTTHSSFCYRCGDGGAGLMMCNSCPNVAHKDCTDSTDEPEDGKEEWNCRECRSERPEITERSAGEAGADGEEAVRDEHSKGDQLE